MDSPLILFSRWLEDARAHPAISEPTAMTLATADAQGRPSARMVLLKEAGEEGFVFYTNSESRKGGELDQNPRAALVFYWMPLKRQVRVEGRVERVSAAEADAYFASRSEGSRLGAWASAQSRPLVGRFALLRRVAQMKLKYAGSTIPRPPHWNGYRVIPERIEFWEEGAFRLHNRFLYTQVAQGWSVCRLNP